MRAKSLADLRTAVRQITHTEFDQAVTDLEIDGRLNEGLSSLDDILVATYQHYRVKTFDFTLTGGPAGNAATLPTDFYKDVFLNRNPDSSTPETVHTFTSLPERNALRRRSYTILGVDQLVIGPPSMAAGVYRLTYTPLIDSLFDPTIVVQTGDTVNSGTKAWFFGGYTFDSTYVGSKLFISGSAAGNNGNYTVTSVSGHNLVTATSFPNSESLSPATVTASCQPSGTVSTLGQIYLPWYEYLQTYAGIAVRDKFGLPVGNNLGAGLTALKARITALAAVRQEEGGQVPMARQGTGFWLDDDGIYK
jgi:hypothetical protein